MQKAVIYARQSSGDDDKSESVEVQISKMQELAAREGLAVIGVYSDLNTSGKTYPEGSEVIANADISFNAWYSQQTKAKKFREGLGQVVKMLAAVDYVLVYDLTRLYRPATNSFLEAHINTLFIQSNTLVFSSREGKIDFSTLNANIVTSLTNRINDEQIATAKKKSIEAMNALRDKGIKPVGNRVTGYRYIGKHRYEIEPKEAEQIKTAYRMVLEGKSYASIVKTVNTMRGLKQGKGYKQGEGMISQSTLMNILRNPTYAGLMRNTDGELINIADGYLEPLVTLADWHKAQEIIEPKHKQVRQKKYYLALSGLLRCGYCGRNMIIVSTWQFGDKDHALPRTHAYRCVYGRNVALGDCNYSAIKYSSAPVPFLEDVKEVEHAVAKDAFSRHLAKAGALLGDTPDKMQIQGIYDAVLPLLALELIKEINARYASGSTDERINTIKTDLANNATKRKKILEFVTNDVISMDDAKTQLETLKAADVNLNAELTSLMAAQDKNESEGQLYQWLLDVQRGTLSPAVYSLLIRRLVSYIECFASGVKVHFKTGGVVKISRVAAHGVYAMPQHRLDITPLENGGFRAEVRYYNKSCFIKARDVEEMPVYDDGSIKILEVGKNNAPGTANSFSGIADARCKAMERDRNQCGW